MALVNKSSAHRQSCDLSVKDKGNKGKELKGVHNGGTQVAIGGRVRWELDVIQVSVEARIINQGLALKAILGGESLKQRVERGN